MSKQAADPAAPIPARSGNLSRARGEGRGADYLPPLMGVAGFGLGLLLLFWARQTVGGGEFPASRQFFMWAALVAGQIALWLALAVPLYRSLREFRMERAVAVKAVLYGVGALVLIYLGHHHEPLSPLPHHSLRMTINNLLGSAVVGLALVGIWLAQAALRKLSEEIEPAREGAYNREVIGKFLRIRGQLERFLLAAGIFVGAATLATGALRNVTLAFVKEIDFPIEYVLIYGLLSTGLLTLVYAPAHAQLVAVRTRLREALVPLPDAKPASWAEWTSERKAVEELLEIHSGVIASLVGSVSILTPLFASLLALLLPSPGS